MPARKDSRLCIDLGLLRTCGLVKGFLAVSDSAAEMLGYPPREMVGMDVHHMIHGGQIEAIGKSLLRLKVNPDAPQFVLLRLQTEKKSNRLVELEATAVLSNGNIYAYFFRLHPVLLEGD